MVTEDEVLSAYRAILGREPESSSVLRTHLAQTSLESLLKGFLESPERQLATRSGPLWGYASSFDPVALARKFEDRGRVPVEGHRVNFLGVAVNVRRFFPSLNLRNEVEPIPLPGNWHTDIAEVGAALRAVDLSGDTFTMTELGCGWGCWMNLTGAAARSIGKQIHLIGVEADEGHMSFAKEALETNGFAPEQYELVRGIAAGHNGSAFFPRQARAGEHWGLEPEFNPTPDDAARFRKSGSYDELKMIPLADIIGARSKIDLLHIDIQGGEAQFLREALQSLNDRVAYVVVGTHSRVLDGEVIAILSANGWKLEIERPTLFHIQSDRFQTDVDGVQGWRNPRLGLA